MFRSTTEPEHFSSVPNNVRWRNSHKPWLGRFMLESRKKLHTMQMVQHLDRTPEMEDPHPQRCSSPATTMANLILQGKINSVKIKAKAKLFRADSSREREMVLSFFHMRRVTKGDLHAHPSGCCLDLPARSQ